MRRAKILTAPEKPRSRRPARQAPRAAQSEWTWPDPTYPDATGIDRDIEILLDLVQETEGCTRDKASAELLRRLSFAA